MWKFVKLRKQRCLEVPTIPFQKPSLCIITHPDAPTQHYSISISRVDTYMGLCYNAFIFFQMIVLMISGAV